MRAVIAQYQVGLCAVEEQVSGFEGGGKPLYGSAEVQCAPQIAVSGICKEVPFVISRTVVKLRDHLLFLILLSGELESLRNGNKGCSIVVGHIDRAWFRIDGSNTVSGESYNDVTLLSSPVHYHLVMGVIEVCPSVHLWYG